MNLTPRQQQIYDYIHEHQRQKGYAPSQRDIQHHFGFASQTTVVDHLRLLEKKGVLEWKRGHARAIAVAAPIRNALEEVMESVMSLPVFGSIPAGMPVEAMPEAGETVFVPYPAMGLRPGPHRFGLRVRGDSMIGAHICEGDLVILELREPRAGEIVAALIDGETTLKRYVIEEGKPVLKAENPDYRKLYPAHELVVQGVMVGLIRQGTG
ncbi:MAG: transcriptional repressor LexA [Verrucomicrobiae bacterium]|nr:transcriptional repressor LexA [Verrucomicrobiae bacterium]